jgi:hypothetical protein
MEIKSFIVPEKIKVKMPKCPGHNRPVATGEYHFFNRKKIYCFKGCYACACKIFRELTRPKRKHN